MVLSLVSPTASQPLDPSKGYLVPGLALTPTLFVGAVLESQLFALAPDPRLAEDAKAAALAPLIATVATLRRDVQRQFEGAKARNVALYATYLERVQHGAAGFAPPLLLWTPDPLMTTDSGFGYLQVPFASALVAIDGETQLAARYERARLATERSDEMVPVVIAHGRPVNWARQVFHDVNLFAIRPNTTVAVAMDDRDPLTAVARAVISEVPFLTGRVSTTRRQLRGRDPEVVTLAALRLACATLAGGVQAVQRGARAGTLPAEDVPLVTRVAVEWFGALTVKLGEALTDRERLAGSGPLWAAFGAIGHPLLDVPQRERAGRIRSLLATFDGIDWARGDQWSGIAGKVSPTGRFAIGSAKEYLYQLTKALTDVTDPGYARVRRAPAAVSAQPPQPTAQ